MEIHFLTLVWTLSIYFRTGGASELIIGVVYEESNVETAYGYNLAHEYVNNYLPRSVHHQVVIKHRTVTNWMTSFQYIQQVCNLMGEGIHILIGPERSTDTKATVAITQAYRIPHIAPYATDPTLSYNSHDYPYLLKLNVPDSFQAAALGAVTSVYTWTQYAVIASTSDYGRNGAAEFLRVATTHGWLVGSVTFFYPFPESSRVNITQDLLNIKEKGLRIVVLWCLAEHARVILRDASALGMLEEGWAWLASDGITLFDTQLPGEGSDQESAFLGLLGLRPQPSNTGGINQFREFWLNVTGANITGFIGAEGKAFDAVLTATYALDSFLADGNNLTMFRPDSPCGQQPDYWVDGRMLMEYLEAVDAPGVMGHLKFTPQRYPETFVFEIVNRRTEGWVKVGEWGWSGIAHFVINSTGVLFPGESPNTPYDQAFDLSHVHLRIVTILERPYMEYNAVDGEYTGLLMDLLDLIQQNLGFTYALHVVADGKYGMETWDGNQTNWDGLVAELLRDHADLVLAPFSITNERLEVIDQTLPYQDITFNVLLPKDPPEDGYWWFLEPFEWPLWYAVCGSFVISSLVKSLCSFLSPFGYKGRHIQRRHRQSDKYVRDQDALNIKDSLWYSLAAWMTQAYDLTPLCLSGRVIHAIWWFATIVYVASYTANMAAILTTARMDTGITSASDLANQEEISYGTVASSAVHQFLASQDMNPYRVMFEHMESQMTYVNVTADGIDRVRKSYGQSQNGNGGYALVFDGPVLKHASAQTPCVLTTFEHSFVHMGYGLGLQKNSPYTKIFNFELLKFRESPYLTALINKWFTVMCGDETVDSGQVTFIEMSGVFVFVLFGMLAACVALYVEFVYSAHQDVAYSVANQEEPITVVQALYHRFSTAVFDLARALSPHRFIGQLGERNFSGAYDVTNQCCEAGAPDAQLIGVNYKAELGMTYENPVFSSD